MGAFVIGPERICTGESVCFNFGFPHTDPMSVAAPNRAYQGLLLILPPLPAGLLRLNRHLTRQLACESSSAASEKFGKRSGCHSDSVIDRVTTS